MKDFIFQDYFIGQRVFFHTWYSCIVLDFKDGLYLVRPFCDRFVWCKSSDLRAS